jgi:hypothetical protein
VDEGLVAGAATKNPGLLPQPLRGAATVVVGVILKLTIGIRFNKEKTKMKKLAFLTIVLLLLGVRSSFAQDIRYDFDKDKDFSKYKTYKWVPIKGADTPDDLTAKQITSAIDTELASKGLTKTDSDSADLYIGYQTAIGTEKQFTSYNTGWGYGPGWGRGWYGYGGMATTTTYGSTSTVYVGQLDLSIYDAAQKELVWRGTATKTLDPKAKPDKKQKNITKTVQKLLKNFPPAAKK